MMMQLLISVILLAGTKKASYKIAILSPDFNHIKIYMTSYTGIYSDFLIFLETFLIKEHIFSVNGYEFPKPFYMILFYGRTALSNVCYR